MKTTQILFIFLVSSLLFTSCIKETPLPEPLGVYEDGFFIVNEGPFANGSGSGTLTFLDYNYLTLEQNVYENVNHEVLGNIVQSMAFNNENAYIVVNNSHKIVIANRYTMKKIAVISTGLNNPRYIEFHGNLAYVSNWGDPMNPNDDFVAVLDLSNNTIIKNISVGEGPEKMLINNTKLFVALKGGYGQNDKVAIINTNTNTLTTSVSVGFVPNSMVIKDNKLVVLCSGKPSWTFSETAGSVFDIDLVTNAVTNRLNFTTTQHPQFLNLDNGMFYYFMGGNVYKWNGSSIVPTTSEQGLSGAYYGMQTKAGKLYTMNAGDYSSNGVMKIFNLTTNTELKSVPTGIIPNAVAFN